MPLQVTPWDELADAYEECAEAARTDDDTRQRAALDRLAAAKEACGCLGQLLLLMALDTGGTHLSRKLARVFGGLARGAWDRATAAATRADWAAAKIDALEQRIRNLERGAETPSVQRRVI